MKPQKYHIIFGVITVIFCVSTLSHAQAPEPDETMLIAPANPALGGIKVLNVVVAIRQTETSKIGLDSKSLKAKVEGILKKAGISIFVPREGVTFDMDISSDLKVSIEILDLDDLQRCVFRVHTSLSRGVCLIEQRNLAFKADVWATEPVMQTEQVRNVSDKVTKVVLEQADGFIQAYRIANTVDKRLPDADNKAPEGISKAPSGKPMVEFKYVASKNSEVFHTPNCRSAKRISPENIVGYSNREDAIKAGKRPCKVCKP